MKILVLVKEVPDMQRVRFDSEKGRVDRSSARAEINPFDLNALAAALTLKGANADVITALTMGPPGAVGSLRDAYARGADEICLMSDRKFGGADTLATSKTLAAGIQTLGKFDLILCGEKSVDGDTAQIGPEVAEHLGLPHMCYVEEILSCDGETVTAALSELGGKRQIRSIKLPAVLCVTKNVAAVKLPTVLRKLESLEQPVKILDYPAVADYVSEQEVGGKGSPTKVRKILVQKKPERSGVTYKDEKGFFDALDAKFKELSIG